MNEVKKNYFRKAYPVEDGSALINKNIDLINLKSIESFIFSVFIVILLYTTVTL